MFEEKSSFTPDVRRYMHADKAAVISFFLFDYLYANIYKYTTLATVRSNW